MLYVKFTPFHTWLCPSPLIAFSHTGELPPTFHLHPTQRPDDGEV